MKAIIIVLVGAISYGILSTIVKIAYAEGFTVQEVSGAQFGIATIIIWIIAFFKMKKQLSVVKPSQVVSLLLVGITSGLTGVFYYSSLQYVPASLAIILLFQFTWIGVVIDSVVNQKKPTRETIFSLIMLAIGTIFASELMGKQSGNIPFLGILFGLFSAITYSLFVFFSGKVSQNVHSILRSTFIITGAMITVFIVYPPMFIFHQPTSYHLFFYGLLLALFGPILPTLAFTYGVPKIGPGLATILGAAELPTVLISSMLILKETITPIQWLGVGMILLAIALPQMKFLRHSKAICKKNPK
ncbi:EamA family transporter [Massilibacterium senegalense]|uniref:EamA family transporter n=1 Tax=Massilibacterium senegalense TaxID=1632858 RepID=UPI0007848732|nr:DMT family transporter [Massilibacterium senegalense]